MATVLAPSRADRAFERLYRRYVADVYRYVLAVLQNEADAEDATQTAFLSAYRAYERGERPERPHNWLIAIAHNVCRQRFRESARRPRLVELEEESVAAHGSDDDAPNAEEICRALGFLAFNQRAALVMRELQGHSYGEIAEILGLSTSAVETLLFRARRAMREQLEGGLSCREAELALSKRADGELSFAERGPLRAHLRECADCASLERGQRFRRRALRSLGVVPLPSSLGSFFGGAAGTTGAGVAGTGVGVGAKAAAVVAAGALGSGLAGDAITERNRALEEPAAAAHPRPALAQERASTPRARTERSVGGRRFLSTPRRAAPRRSQAAPSAAASVAASAVVGASLSHPVEQAPATETAAEPTPAAPPEPTPPSETPTGPSELPAVEAAPALPIEPPPAPPPVPPPPEPAPPEVAVPPVPALPEPPKLPLPLAELPKPPRPELPKAPRLELPKTPRVEVPATTAVVQP
jgi:RNA polymerase sigma-70 factor (ECF subfamily)